MNLYYVNSVGKKVDFSNWPIMYQEPESLLQKEWKYEWKDDPLYGGKVSRFYRGIEEKSLRVSVFAEDAVEFDVIMDTMDECFETDIARMETGRLYFNNSYLRCYIKSTSFSEWEEDFCTVDQQFSVLAEYPFWITERQYIFKSSEITSTDNKRYPYRYGYRYANGLNSTKIINSHFAECNFRMVIYGPCVNPHVIIGNHIYQIYIVLAAGEYLTIDSLTQTVKKTMNNGTIVNAFHNRDKQLSVFKKINPGINTVKWPYDFDFDITLFEERSSPI